jgi:Tfp pilus assembly protein PilX
MKKIIVLLFASLLGFGMTAHAADDKGVARQEQVKKLRAQADAAHRKGDALTAQADKLESAAGVKSDEKMRGAVNCNLDPANNSGQCAYKASPISPARANTYPDHSCDDIPGCARSK